MFADLKAFFCDKWPILIAWNIVIGLFFYAYGCESKTTSLMYPQKKVTRQILQSEIDFLLHTGDIRFAELDKQDELKQMIFNQGLLIAQGNQINPVGVITTLMAIMGIGAGADDLRLRKARKKYLSYSPVEREDPK
ncbi:hypothetical protein KAR91_35440 [Candidatus Pacearchaeota archaeon]|nr:hypothetical protein [Candidatus Pacearchaeota archaeon]